LIIRLQVSPGAVIMPGYLEELLQGVVHRRRLG
jgi:hypothetical protein